MLLVCLLSLYLREADGGTCGGNVAIWKTLHATDADCCESTLSWISTAVCSAESLLSTPIGTLQWYVDWLDERCVQDCDTSTNSTCGGVVTSAHVALHDSATSCCSDKLGWVPSTSCEADSTNTPISSAGSNGWYVDHKRNRCVKDCKGASPCGGLVRTLMSFSSRSIMLNNVY